MCDLTFSAKNGNINKWPLQVTVILDKTEDMCSVAFNGPHRQKVTVQGISSALVSYTIIPLKTGELPLQLTAIASNFMGQDAVRKNLHVVVNMLKKIYHIYNLFKNSLLRSGLFILRSMCTLSKCFYLE